jgi:FixJ family two-component response regulator
MTGDPIVFVVDDDPSMREALADLIRELACRLIVGAPGVWVIGDR